MNSLKFINSFIYLISFLMPLSLYSQSIQDIGIEQIRDTVRIRYNLVSIRNDDIYEIRLAVSDDNGEKFNIIPNSISGDIGFGVKPKSNLTIDWTPLEDSLELIGENYVFKLVGDLLGGSKEIDFVEIPGGTFMMGSSDEFANTDEKRVHEVYIDDFEMSVYEVTNFQFMLFLNLYGSDEVKDGEYKGKPIIYPHPKGLSKLEHAKQNTGIGIWVTNAGFEYFPVVNVTWYGANEFCKYYGYRFPTEAEWEYAAREEGKNIRFGNGKQIADPKEINFDGRTVEKREYSKAGESRNSQIRVASFSPNQLRLFDMSGNVWEWCQDWYESNYYFYSKKDNPTGPWFGDYKVIRGGSWFNNAQDIRSTDRSFFPPLRGNTDVGFRVVRQKNNNE